MNDNDYIKVAVELADGWRATAGGCQSPSGRYCWIEDPDQETVDALAAQLVRQVDALPIDADGNEPAMVELDHGEVRVYNFDIPPPAANVTAVCGPDRTLNTIKAIVDSGVLE